MTAFQPSAAEERAAAVRHAAAGWQNEGAITAEERAAIDARTVPAWRAHGPLPYAVFFILTLVAAAAVEVLLHVLGVPAPEFITGVMSIVLAEVLIQRTRLFGSGIESALWLAGMIAFVASLPSSGKVEALLVIALAVAIAGARVRSALFGAAAVVILCAYAAAKPEAAIGATVGGALIGLGAAVLLRAEWQRPSTERLLHAVAIAAPLASLGASAEFLFHHRSAANGITNALLAVSLLAFALRARDRVLMIAAAVAAAIAAYQLGDFLRFSAEAQLLAAGAAMMAAAAVLSRLLRGRQHGFVVTPASAIRYDEVIQLAGAMSALQTSAPPAAAPEHSGGGGSFGGAGASGDY